MQPPAPSLTPDQKRSRLRNPTVYKNAHPLGPLSGRGPKTTEPTSYTGALRSFQCSAQWIDSYLHGAKSTTFAQNGAKPKTKSAVIVEKGCCKPLYTHILCHQKLTHDVFLPAKEKHDLRAPVAVCRFCAHFGATIGTKRTQNAQNPKPKVP